MSKIFRIFMVLLQKQLKSLHLIYFDLFTIMILTFSNSQVWASIVDPDQIAAEGGEPDHSQVYQVFWTD